MAKYDQPNDSASVYRQRSHGLEDRLVGSYGLVLLKRLVVRGCMAAVSQEVQTAFIPEVCFFSAAIILNGTTHLFSDLAGIGHGFRDANQWLAALTNASLPASFYTGDALGSFNSWARLITGILAGLGIVWLAFPNLEEFLGKDEDQSSIGR